MEQPLLTEQAHIGLTVCDGVNFTPVVASVRQRVIDVLRQQGFYVNAPCGGRGTCGKCRIKILQGQLELQDTTNASVRLAEPGEMVLACRSFLVEDCTIDVSQLTEQGFVATADFVGRQIEPIVAEIETVMFVPAADCWQDGQSATEVICLALGRELEFSAKALRQLSCWLGLSWQNNYSPPTPEMPLWLTLRASRVLQVGTAESTTSYGIGVDIGTTTIALSLVDLKTGNTIKNLTLLNSQRQFGADVISRIQKSTEGFTKELQDCLRTDLAQAVTELCGNKADQVLRMVVAGNTTMLHLLLGLRADSLALFPFTPLTIAQLEWSSAELFGSFPIESDVTVLPSLGAYVGADMIAGLLFCQMDQSPQLSLLIDLGTNGEMALGNRSRILCTSTAAGPAFEGANISCGVGSIPGAIAKFEIKDGQTVIGTIADAPPIGICGSGVVDIIAAGLREGFIDRSGRLAIAGNGGDCWPIIRNAAGEWIQFSQKDIREFQLAKAAVRSGLEILLREYGCGWADIGQVYLAGGFGAKIDADSAIAVGLFPAELRGKIQPVGNSVLGGTMAYLLHQNRRSAVKTLLQLSSIIDLSRQAEFNDLFMEQLQFADPILTQHSRLL